ncbi:MAG: YHS domain-containing protein [bacterium]|nr:YHS domain-containing protein [bacterium]
MINIKSFFGFGKNNGEEPIRSAGDPVCGMRPAHGINIVHEGVTYTFCSEHCAEQFRKDPKRYAKS